jgi:hypothetical protein
MGKTKRTAWEIIWGIIEKLLVMAIVALPGYLAWIQKMPLFVIPLSVLVAAGAGLLFVNQWNTWKKGWGFARFSENRAEKKSENGLSSLALRLSQCQKSKI